MGSDFLKLLGSKKPFFNPLRRIKKMKKLLTVSVILLMVTSAMAADWSFSGSQRLATWYVDRNYGDNKVNGQNDDQATQWYFQGNSRLEAKVRAEKVNGHIEIALGTPDDSGGDGNVTTRRAYGTWKFADNAWLKIGKDYSPTTEFISNQWFSEDLDLLGYGVFFGRRPAGLTLGIGGFELAFLSPSYGTDVGTTATGINGVTSGDPDSYIPRLEASYMLTLGAGYIKPFGGFQYYTVEENGIGNVTGDLDVWSWVLGITTSWSIRTFTISGQISYGMNEGNVRGWQTSFYRSLASAYLKNGDDLANTYTLQTAIVPALSVTDDLRFEAGLGYRVDNADGAPGPSQPINVLSLYLQAMVTMAPGVFLCPEVGYSDFNADSSGNDRGWQWYAGTKWQVDF
jgi:hypothetical protein